MSFCSAGLNGFISSSSRAGGDLSCPVAVGQLRREQIAGASQYLRCGLFLRRRRITVFVEIATGRQAERAEQAQLAEGPAGASGWTPKVLPKQQTRRREREASRRQKPTVMRVALDHYTEGWSEPTV